MSLAIFCFDISTLAPRASPNLDGLTGGETAHRGAASLLSWAADEENNPSNNPPSHPRPLTPVAAPEKQRGGVMSPHRRALRRTRRRPPSAVRNSGCDATGATRFTRGIPGAVPIQLPKHAPARGPPVRRPPLLPYMQH